MPVGSLALISFASLMGWTRSGLWKPRYSGYLTIAAIFAALLLSFWVLDSVIDADGAPIGFEPHRWVTVGELEVDIGVTVDGLTAIMLIVVTSISLLVQFYSQEYMRGDLGYNRYYAFMSLFTAAMLGLVLASSILQIFVFWELVGLTSYLLIGFWFFRDSARKAATKAFIVTRVGDLGFLSAILLIWTQTGELNIPHIQELAATGAIGSSVLAFFAGGLFAGAAGKSAQFPLHVWLPDAMEGPTPVSALIHAATMVAAGVYLVARFFPVFAVSPEAINTVMAIGAITAITSALLGIVATDIKRVLAYSTISQLGYMMMGLGVGGFVAGIFHLFTHAFFKANLFLSAGSVNHATGTFDMRKMGGLRRYLPLTFLTTLIPSLALIGIFPFAGFWSKDDILKSAWAGQQWVFWVAMVGVFLTAVYVGRMLLLTFGGEYKGGEESPHGTPGHEEEEGGLTSDHDTHAKRPHESPWIMVLPLVILSVLSVGAGFVNINEDLAHFLEASLPHETEELLVHGSFSWWIAIGSVAAGVAGLAVAWAIYGLQVVKSERIREAVQPLPEVLENKYYLDDLYEKVFLKDVLLGGIGTLLAFFDKYIIDGVVNGAASLTRWSGGLVRQAQAGQAQLYGAAIFVGMLVAVATILIVTPP